MNTTFIWYEQPLNERQRLFLRLEYLFKQFKLSTINNQYQENPINEYYREQHAFYAQQKMIAFLEILGFCERLDIRQDLLKELEYLQQYLNKIHTYPGVCHNTLQQHVNTIDGLIDELGSSSGKIGLSLLKIDWLNQIRQRLYVPGGLASCDIPTFYHWLQLDIDTQNEFFNSGYEEFKAVSDTVSIILTFIRESGQIESLDIGGGFYQRNFENHIKHQLVRVGIAHNDALVPEISASKHRLNIRFIDSEFKNYGKQVKQTEQDVCFKLMCCSLGLNHSYQYS